MRVFQFLTMQSWKSISRVCVAFRRIARDQQVVRRNIYAGTWPIRGRCWLTRFCNTRRIQWPSTGERGRKHDSEAWGISRAETKALPQNDTLASPLAGDHEKEERRVVSKG